MSPTRIFCMCSNPRISSWSPFFAFPLSTVPTSTEPLPVILCLLLIGMRKGASLNIKKLLFQNYKNGLPNEKARQVSPMLASDCECIPHPSPPMPTMQTRKPPLIVHHRIHKNQVILAPQSRSKLGISRNLKIFKPRQAPSRPSQLCPLC